MLVRLQQQQHLCCIFMSELVCVNLPTQVTRRTTAFVQSTLTLDPETVSGLQSLRVTGAQYNSCVNSEHMSYIVFTVLLIYSKIK